MIKRTGSKEVRSDKALEFRVSELIDVKLIKAKCGRIPSDEAIRKICSKHKRFTECYGCYVYSVKASKGYTPIYVGSATKQTLGEEAFGPEKRLKILEQMAYYQKGTLKVSFIVPADKIDSNLPTRRGKCPKNLILKMEKVLTAIAYRKNARLINKKNRALQGFFINGALNSDAGRPSGEVREFKKMIGLRDKSMVVLFEN